MNTNNKHVKTAIVLGSGGHTGEMIKLLGGCNLNIIEPREYIIADSDQMSIQKIKAFEANNKNTNTHFNLNRIARSRHVGQSYFTSVFTTLIAIFYSIPLIFKIKPSLLIVNGPGTCIPLCLIVFILSRILFLIPKCKIVFVESSKFIFLHT